MKILLDVYDFLRQLGACGSEQDFSIRWLGKSRTYFAYLRSTGNLPSVEALVHLTARLFHISAALLARKPMTTKLKQVARKTRDIGNDVLNDVLSVAFGEALALSSGIEQTNSLREREPPFEVCESAEQMLRRAETQRDAATAQRKSAQRLEAQGKIASLRDRLRDQQQTLAAVNSEPA
jgi:hypothetical protein